MSHADRRASCRYPVPGHAQLWWEGGAGVPASVSNVSATGCRLEGEALPQAGERVWLSLKVPGLPDLRLPAHAVRECTGPDGKPRAALRFAVPSERAGGLDLLLLQYLQRQDGRGVVLLVEPDAKERDRLLKSIRRPEVRAVAVARTGDALRIPPLLRIETLLARAHPEGVLALLTLGPRIPRARRVIMGDCDAARLLQKRGDVDEIVEDRPQIPGLQKVIEWSRAREA